MGERKHTEGKVSRRPKRQAPPADSETAKSAGDQKGKPPLRTANTPAPAPPGDKPLAEVPAWLVL